MPDCYTCGASIFSGEGRRRVVKTGGSRRTYSGGRYSSSSNTVNFGPRTLCALCAKKHDRQGTVMVIVATASFIVMGLTALKFMG